MNAKQMMNELAMARTLGGSSSAVTTHMRVPYPILPRNKNPITDTRGSQPRTLLAGSTRVTSVVLVRSDTAASFCSFR